MQQIAIHTLSMRMAAFVLPHFSNALLFFILSDILGNVLIVIRAGRVRQIVLFIVEECKAENIELINSSRTFFPHSTNRDVEVNAVKLTLAYPNMIIRTRTTLM